MHLSYRYKLSLQTVFDFITQSEEKLAEKFCQLLIKLAENFIHKILIECDNYKWRGEIGYIFNLISEDRFSVQTAKFQPLALQNLTAERHLS